MTRRHKYNTRSKSKSAQQQTIINANANPIKDNGENDSDSDMDPDYVDNESLNNSMIESIDESIDESLVDEEEIDLESESIGESDTEDDDDEPNEYESDYDDTEFDVNNAKLVKAAKGEIKDIIKCALTKVVDKVFDYKKGSSIEEEEDPDAMVEDLYFDTLPEDKKKQITELKTQIENYNDTDIPIKYRVLESNHTLAVKCQVLNKLSILEKNENTSEYFKYMSWLNELLKVPVGIYNDLPISTKNTKEEIQDYLIHTTDVLNNCVHGHVEAKHKILQIVAQWIVNPGSYGQIIGLMGPPGTGKTTLVKDGISKALDKPFEMIALGGATDSAFLEGHSYTYEGSHYGRIASILIQAKCMNPIIYMDELDKVSETKHGEEIVNVLMHLTDTSQNNNFQDKYFQSVPLDLSKALFIFSFNDIERINPILRDRMHIISTDAHTKQDKLVILKNYLIPKIMENNGFKMNDIVWSDDTLNSIIDEVSGNESGVRELKRSIEEIVMKLNTIRLTHSPKYNLLNIPDSVYSSFSLPYTVSSSAAKALLKNRIRRDSTNAPPPMMYL